MEKVTFLKSDYKPSKKVKFEDIETYIPNNDFNTLTPIYGDYMQLPPESERHQTHEYKLYKIAE